MTDFPWKFFSSFLMIRVPPACRDYEILKCKTQEVVKPVITDDVEAFSKIKNVNQNTTIWFTNADPISMIHHTLPLGSLCLIYGAEKCFNYLCDHFEMKDLADDYKERSPLLYAAAGGNLNLFKKVYNMNEAWRGRTDKDEANFCHYAAKYNQLQVVQYIYYHMKKVDNTSANATPLMWACLNNAVDIVRFLVDIIDMDVNTKTVGGWTALHYATKYNNIEATEILLSCSSIDLHNLNLNDPKNGFTNPYTTPLHFAINNGCAINVKALIDAGFLLTKDDYIEAIKYMYNYEMQNGSSEVYKYKDDKQKLDCINAFLDNEKALNEYGEVIIIESINEEYKNVDSFWKYTIKSFTRTCEEVNKHADIVSSQNFMKFIASKVGNPKKLGDDNPHKWKLFEDLFSISLFNPDWTDENGKNLINYALVENNEEMVSKLIEIRVNPNQEDNNGKKIVSYAAAISESMLNIIIEAPTFDHKKCIMDLITNPASQR